MPLQVRFEDKELPALKELLNRALNTWEPRKARGADRPKHTARVAARAARAEGGGVSYSDYIARKLGTTPATGIADGFSVPGSLFPHQSALTAWAIRRGRAAIFADTGLGKSRMQLAWADAVQRHTKRPVLILAPLAVAQQTVAEARSIGIDAVERKLNPPAEDASAASPAPSPKPTPPAIEAEEPTALTFE